MNDTAPAMTTPPDGTTVFRRVPSPHLEWVEVDDEIVAWSEPESSLHLLDPIASLVFQLVDGDTPLAQTIDDLAEAFDRDHEQISGDILTCVATLESNGLVERAR